MNKRGNVRKGKGKGKIKGKDKGKIKCKGKGKVHPTTGHENPEGSRGTALLFL